MKKILVSNYPDKNLLVGNGQLFSYFSNDDEVLSGGGTVTLFLDLNATGSGHAGTNVDPYSFIDWQFTLTTSVGISYDFYVRGQLITDSITIRGNSSTRYFSWDPAINGPWRIQTREVLSMVGEIGGTHFHDGILFMNDGTHPTDLIYSLISGGCVFSGMYVSCANFSGQIASIEGTLFKIASNFNVTGGPISDSAISAMSFTGDAVPFGYIAFNNCACTGDNTSYLKSYCQMDWIPPAFPAFNSSRGPFQTSVLYADVATPPEPGFGYPAYHGYENDYTVGLWGDARTGIGAGYFGSFSSLNYFDQTSVMDGTLAHSVMDLGNVVSKIQSINPDTYFDSTNKIGTVYVYYTHQDGRQRKKLVHDSAGHQAPVSWTPNARDGTWQKTELKVFDKDGAITFVMSITGEDLTHSAGATTLNVI
jgi:hypothetical protein